MATAAQMNANRENAKKSTGPTSEAGKAKSSMNRLSHGFASNLRFLKSENPEEFHALLADLTTEHQPTTPTQQILVEKMALNQWISLRATRMQVEMLLRATGEGLRSILPLLLRYQTAADRSFHKCYDVLLKVQKQDPKPEIGFVSEKAPLGDVCQDDAPAPDPKIDPKPAHEPVPEPAPAPAFLADFDLKEEMNHIMTMSMEEMSAYGRQQP